MADLFSEFLENPTGETFRALRNVLIEQPEFNFYSRDLAEVQALAEEEEFEDVILRAEEAMPDWLLSPSMHRYLAVAARAEGDSDRADQEEYLVKACRRGLLQSGDGSPQRPYLILHPADEYDVLAALGKEPAEQQLLNKLAPPLDRIRCVDGAELHFDLTPSLPQGEPVIL